MKEGRSVYMQEHDSKSGDEDLQDQHYKLFSEKGVWMVWLGWCQGIRQVAGG